MSLGRRIGASPNLAHLGNNWWPRLSDFAQLALRLMPSSLACSYDSNVKSGNRAFLACMLIQFKRDVGRLHLPAVPMPLLVTASPPSSVPFWMTRALAANDRPKNRMPLAAVLRKSASAGKVPFTSDSIIGLYNQICTAPLRFPEEVFVSDSIKHLITRLLDKDPDNRISLASTMVHPWVTHNMAYPLPNIQVPACLPSEMPSCLGLVCLAAIS